jgi:hypothetical protein
MAAQANVIQQAGYKRGPAEILAQRMAAILRADSKASALVRGDVDTGIRVGHKLEPFPGASYSHIVVALTQLESENQIGGMTDVLALGTLYVVRFHHEPLELSSPSLGGILTHHRRIFSTSPFLHLNPRNVIIPNDLPLIKHVRPALAVPVEEIVKGNRSHLHALVIMEYRLNPDAWDAAAQYEEDHPGEL